MIFVDIVQMDWAWSQDYLYEGGSREISRNFPRNSRISRSVKLILWNDKSIFLQSAFIKIILRSCSIHLYNIYENQIFVELCVYFPPPSHVVYIYIYTICACTGILVVRSTVKVYLYRNQNCPERRLQQSGIFIQYEYSTEKYSYTYSCTVGLDLKINNL